MKQTVNLSPGYSQYSGVNQHQQQNYQPIYQQSPPASASIDQGINYNYQQFKRENEFVQPGSTASPLEQFQPLNTPEDQRFENSRAVLNRANSAPTFTSANSNSSIYHSPNDVVNRNLLLQQSERNDIQNEHYSQRSYTTQPYDTAGAATQFGRASWTTTGHPNQPNAILYDQRDTRLMQPEYYNQQPQIPQQYMQQQMFPQQQQMPYNPMNFHPQAGFHPMDMRFQGYPGFPPNMAHFSMTTQSGPIPASKPKISMDEKTGEELITFSYSKQKVIREFTVRVPLEKFDTSSLTEEFKKDNCVYPKAVIPIEQYKGNRYKYETECNEMGWTLSWFNEEIRNHRGLIQRAVDSWRNTRPDKSIRSRRARRDID